MNQNNPIGNINFTLDLNNSNNNQIKKGRRKHIKSKNGCTNCKQRKIKCDETLPICSFCEKRGIQCSYLTMTPFQIYQIEKDHGLKTNNNNNKIENFNNGGFNYNNYNAPINLSNDTIYNDNLIYQAHEIESLLLPSSMTNKISFNKIENSNTNINNLKQNINLVNNNNFPNKTIPLSSNTKRSNRIFEINHDKIINELKKFIRDSSFTLNFLMCRDFESLTKILNGKKLDSVLKYYFLQILSIYSIFDKLLKKSLFLLSMDIYKNTILKQPILKMINYKFKLLISKTCENYSIENIDEITNIIKNEYLPNFNNFSTANVNLCYGCLLVLNDCLGYHFKNGLKFDMSLDDGNNSTNLVGIFITGFYSLVMERSKAEILMSGTNILAAHLIEKFKRLLVKNYDSKIFDDFRLVVEKMSNKYSNNDNNNINYENLKLFCAKHSKLLSLNIYQHSLVGYNIGYLIRLLNSFQSIVPFDICNLSPNYEEIFKGRENEIIVYLLYFTLGFILDSIIPGMPAELTNGFQGTGWHMLDLYDTKNLIKMLKLINDKPLKLIGIYLIRTSAFIKTKNMYYKKILLNLPLNDILDENNELSINERYLKLLNLKVNNIINEIQVKTFLLDKGLFFKKWNYPNTENLKPTKNNRNSDIKIMNYFKNDDEIIDDFFKTNTGFFSQDYDCLIDSISENEITKQTTFTDGFQMKMIWKLITYIRINNL